MSLLVTKDEFYNQRDDRTNRYCGAQDIYQHARVLVLCSPEKIHNYNAQLISLTSCNILSRFCRNVTVVTPNVPLHAKLADDQFFLRDQIRSVMQNADPFGEFDFAEHIPETGNWDCVILIGAPFLNLNVSVDITIDGGGWIACVGDGVRNFTLIPSGEINPVGPALAAAIGIAEVFKIVTGQKRDHFTTCLSAFNLTKGTSPGNLCNPTLPNEMNLGRCLMVGVGMVGSSTLYFLKKADLKAQLTLIDDDDVKIVNLNRSPIYGIKDCGALKVSVGATYLNKSNIDVSVIPEKFSLQNVQDFDVILPLANENGIRHKLQSILPPLCIHAATAPGWAVSLYRHIPIVENCLECYPTEKRAKPKLACAEDVVQIAEERVDAALPFLPVIAGALIVGELIKLQYEGMYPNIANTVSMEVGGDLWVNAFHRPKTDEECICKQREIEAIHRQMISNSRYAYLTSELR